MIYKQTRTKKNKWEEKEYKDFDFSDKLTQLKRIIYKLGLSLECYKIFIESGTKLYWTIECLLL